MTTRTCRKPARPGRPHDLKRKRPPSDGRPLRNSDIRTLVNLSEVASVAIADIGISYNADLEQAEQVVRELKLAMDRAGIEIPFPQVVVHKGEN